MKKNNKGFTMLETSVALIVAGLVGSMTVPELSTLMDSAADSQQKLNTHAVSTAWDFAYGRHKAAPSLARLANGVKTVSTKTGLGMPSADGKGICLGDGNFVPTYRDEDGRIPTASATDEVWFIGNGSKEAKCQ